MLSITYYDVFVYGLLTLALIALWLPKTIDRFRIRLWHVLCVAAIGGGLLSGYVHPLGLISIALLAISSFLTMSEQHANVVRILAGLVMFVVSVGLSLHIIPGFSNPKIITDVILSQDGTPYSKYLNFDKTLVGLCVLGFTYKNLLTKPQAWGRMLKQAAPISGITILVLLFMSFALGYVRFEPKWISCSFLGIWAWTNLFFTCIAEEAVFRGIMQRYLIVSFSRFRYGATMGQIGGAHV